MSLQAIALRILAAAQSDSLEPGSDDLRALGQVRPGEYPSGELASTLALLQEAKNAAYASRAHVIESIRRLERSTLYQPEQEEADSTWEFAG